MTDVNNTADGRCEPWLVTTFLCLIGIVWMHATFALAPLPPLPGGARALERGWHPVATWAIVTEETSTPHRKNVRRLALTGYAVIPRHLLEHPGQPSTLHLQGKTTALSYVLRDGAVWSGAARRHPVTCYATLCLVATPLETLGAGVPPPTLQVIHGAAHPNVMTLRGLERTSVGFGAPPGSQDLGPDVNGTRYIFAQTPTAPLGILRSSVILSPNGDPQRDIAWNTAPDDPVRVISHPCAMGSAPLHLTGIGHDVRRGRSVHWDLMLPCLGTQP